MTWFADNGEMFRNEPFYKYIQRCLDQQDGAVNQDR